MARKHDPKEIGLKIGGVYPYSNAKWEGFEIHWTSKIGFGVYNIYRSRGSNEWKADSECMDINENKEFITELMRLFIEQLDIVG